MEHGCTVLVKTHMTTWDERMTPRPKREPRLDLIEVCWRLVGPSTHVIECGIYSEGRRRRSDE